MFFPPEVLSVEAWQEPEFQQPEPPVLPEAPLAPAFGKPQYGHDWSGTRPYVIDEPAYVGPRLLDVPQWMHPPRWGWGGEEGGGRLRLPWWWGRAALRCVDQRLGTAGAWLTHTAPLHITAATCQSCQWLRTFSWTGPTWTSTPCPAWSLHGGWLVSMTLPVQAGVPRT